MDITITVPKDRPSGTVVLRGARVITMKGTEVIENADVVVRDNRIAAVGARGQVNAPADARVIDVSGKTIVPGYVDTHAHMYAPGWGLHRTELWQYYVNLAYGVTRTRDPQTGSYDVIDYSDRVETGDVLGPRIYTTAKGFFENEGIQSRSMTHAMRFAGTRISSRRRRSRRTRSAIDDDASSSRRRRRSSSSRRRTRATRTSCSTSPTCSTATRARSTRSRRIPCTRTSCSSSCRAASRTRRC